MSTARILQGAAVADALCRQLKEETEGLIQTGRRPVLALLSVGDRGDQRSYKMGAIKRCREIGIEIIEIAAPVKATEDELCSMVRMLNENRIISGVLPLRPIENESGCNERRVLNCLLPEKDMDGVTEQSMFSLYAGADEGCAPCTAEAVVEMLRYYEIPMQGKHAVILGRSHVIGRPLAMLLLKENASVTICHSHSEDLAGICRSADIVISAVGVPKLLGREHLRQGQTVIDVGMTLDKESGRLLGDVDFEAVQELVAAISPVPGGVGAVTTTVLAKHVVEAAKKRHPGNNGMLQL